MTVGESTELENQNQLPAKKSNARLPYVIILATMGVLGVVAGLMNLLGAVFAGFTPVRTADVIFNIVDGVLILVCSIILAKGKVLAIWFYSGCVLFSIVYGFAMGRGFNFVTAVVGGVLLWLFFNLKKQGELS